MSGRFKIMRVQINGVTKSISIPLDALELDNADPPGGASKATTSKQRNSKASPNVVQLPAQSQAFAPSQPAVSQNVVNQQPVVQSAISAGNTYTQRQPLQFVTNSNPIPVITKSNVVPHAQNVPVSSQASLASLLALPGNVLQPRLVPTSVSQITPVVSRQTPVVLSQASITAPRFVHTSLPHGITQAPGNQNIIRAPVQPVLNPSPAVSFQPNTCVPVAAVNPRNPAPATLLGFQPASQTSFQPTKPSVVQTSIPSTPFYLQPAQSNAYHIVNNVIQTTQASPVVNPPISLSNGNLQLAMPKPPAAAPALQNVSAVSLQPSASQQLFTVGSNIVFSSSSVANSSAQASFNQTQPRQASHNVNFGAAHAHQLPVMQNQVRTLTPGQQPQTAQLQKVPCINSTLSQASLNQIGISRLDPSVQRSAPPAVFSGLGQTAVTTTQVSAPNQIMVTLPPKTNNGPVTYVTLERVTPASSSTVASEDASESSIAHSKPVQSAALSTSGIISSALPVRDLLKEKRNSQNQSSKSDTWTSAPESESVESSQNFPNPVQLDLRKAQKCLNTSQITKPNVVPVRPKPLGAQNIFEQLAAQRMGPQKGKKDIPVNAVSPLHPKPLPAQTSNDDNCTQTDATSTFQSKTDQISEVSSHNVDKESEKLTCSNEEAGSKSSEPKAEKRVSSLSVNAGCGKCMKVWQQERALFDRLKINKFVSVKLVSQLPSEYQSRLPELLMWAHKNGNLDFDKDEDFLWNESSEESSGESSDEYRPYSGRKMSRIPTRSTRSQVRLGYCSPAKSDFSSRESGSGEEEMDCDIAETVKLRRRKRKRTKRGKRATKRWKRIAPCVDSSNESS